MPTKNTQKPARNVTTPAKRRAAKPAAPKPEAGKPSNLPATVAAQPAKPEADASGKPAKLTHFHREAGLTGERYSGQSSYLNANRKTAVKLSNYPRTANDIAASPSTRTPGTLYELREKHAARADFPIRGVDNAVAAMLINAGLLAVVPGSGGKANIGGVQALVDLPGNPVRVTITEAGKAFGKA